jgi:iron complex outermembrane receptor protein
VVGLQFSQDTFEAVGVPETDSSMAGLFWLGKTQLASWGVELGARLETAELSPDQVTNINPSCGPNTSDYQDKHFDTHSLSLGLIRDLALNSGAESQWQLTASVTSAQRAPSTQELFSCGAHAATQTFDVGNPDLQAEQALNIELGLRKIAGDLTAGINLYQNRVDDFIYALNTGEEVDGFGKYKFTQENTTFQGGEFDLAYQASSGLVLTAMADAVRADDMPRIPADRFGLGFEVSTIALFSTQSDWMLFGQWQQVQKQTRVANNEEASLGYDLLTLGLTYQALLADYEYRVDLKANNLLDEEVRQHTSFVKEQAPLPGRNISLGLALNF